MSSSPRSCVHGVSDETTDLETKRIQKLNIVVFCFVRSGKDDPFMQTCAFCMALSFRDTKARPALGVSYARTMIMSHPWGQQYELRSITWLVTTNIRLL